MKKGSDPMNKLLTTVNKLFMGSDPFEYSIFSLVEERIFPYVIDIFIIRDLLR